MNRRVRQTFIYRHSIFDDKLHEVFLNGGKESFTGVLHQRNHQLQDLCHITDDHEVIGSLRRKPTVTTVKIWLHVAIKT